MGRFIELLNSDSLVAIPSCHDPLTARLASLHGFPAVMLAGYDLGAALAVSEPILTADEVVNACRQIKRTTDIPIIVDVGSGFGDPMHIVQLAKDLALIGVDAIQIEDQIYPKRAHYFRDYQEHIIPLEEMVQRIEWVKRTTGDAIAIVARTDAYVTDGEDEALRRMNAFLDVGADGVLAFPNTLDEARRLPDAVTGPAVYVNTNGNRVGRPVLSAQDAATLGYSMLVDVHSALFAAVAAFERVLAQYAQEGVVDTSSHIADRLRLEEVLQISKLWEVEQLTVEAGTSAVVADRDATRA